MSVALDRLRLDADQESRHGGYVLVRGDDVRAVVEVAERAAELSRFLGPDGPPDLRNIVARLDVALEALGDV